MSSSNTFNKNLNETPLEGAYSFQTTKENTQFIQNSIQNNFSPICIFCSGKETFSLLQDGSFRFCRNCRRQFKASFKT